MDFTASTSVSPKSWSCADKSIKFKEVVVGAKIWAITSDLQLVSGMRASLGWDIVSRMRTES